MNDVDYDDTGDYDDMHAMQGQVYWTVPQQITEHVQFKTNTNTQ